MAQSGKRPSGGGHGAKRPSGSTDGASRNRPGSVRVSGAGGNGGAKRSRPVAGMDVVDETPEATTPSRPVPAGWRSRLSRRNLLIGLGVAVLVLIAGFAIYAWVLINKPLPTLAGTAKLAGLSGNATVTRDAYGVPHIEAANVLDLYRAQGYVHAQDRLYQMFFFRTAGEGRLAELISPGLLDADRYLRTLGFRRVADAEYAQIQKERPEVAQALQAYADGVNEFVHSHRDSMPLEFTLLGTGFDDWKPVDTLMFGKLQARDLTETWPQELLMSDMVQRLGSQVAALLAPDYPADAPVIVPGANSGAAMERLAQTYEQTIRPLLGGWREGYGSNNWVVAGSKTDTGKPLLANDPHLGVRNPSIWYQIHLKTTDGKYDATGFGFAGAPGIVTGHNQNIAWGVTNVEADVEDLFLEQLDPVAHPGQYRSGDNWKPLTVLTETIQVKGGETVSQTVRITNHGPILSDALPVSPTVSTSITGTFSVQWTALQPGHLLEALYDLQTASNWQEFRSALSKWDVPGQNFVYADREGNIGYQTTGQMPIRKKGNGKVPAEGWTGENDWSGFIPFDEMPRAYNPTEGYIATANNRPFPRDYKYDVPGYYAEPWRIDRILEMLKAKPKLSLDDMKAMQSDVQSALAKRVAPIFASVRPPVEDTRATQAVDLLKNWDGSIKADSAAAAIYEVTYHQVLTRTLRDDFGADAPQQNLFAQYIDGMPHSALMVISTLLDRPNDPLWDDQTTTDKKETRDDILLASLNGAIVDLARVQGDDMSQWSWGRVHQITPSHEFSGADLVGGLFTLSSQPIGGDLSTVAVASYPLVYATVPLPQVLPVTSHQSYRMIVDLGDWNRSLGIFATGESGQPGSNFRENMYQPWLSFQYNPLLYAKDQIDAGNQGQLTLTP